MRPDSCVVLYGTEATSDNAQRRRARSNVPSSLKKRKQGSSLFTLQKSIRLKTDQNDVTSLCLRLELYSIPNRDLNQSLGVLYSSTVVSSYEYNSIY